MADDYTIFPERKTETVQDEGPVNNLVTTTADTVTGTTETTTTTTEPTIDLTPQYVYGSPKQPDFSHPNTYEVEQKSKEGSVLDSFGKLFSGMRHVEGNVQKTDTPIGGLNPNTPTFTTTGPTKLDNRVITPAHHFEEAIKTYNAAGQSQLERNTNYTFLKRTETHFIPDKHDPNPLPETTPFEWDETKNGLYRVPKFSGAMTYVNPFGDKDKQDIMDRGLGEVVDDEVKAHSSNKDDVYATSPLQPFTRLDPNIARYATIASYNRTHIPVADVEVRNTHRHIFITRPECYICCVEGGLSDQCAHDMDFASVYAKMPYILEMLSPCYITKSFTSDGLRNSNWNFLLSNRIISMDNVNMQLNTIKGSASYQGATTMIPTYANIYEPGTLNLTFRETKNLEVGEMLRMWMLYISNRHRGIFSPPYNGYQKVNGFVRPAKADTDVRTPILHPYDRAIEFPCTIFDIITNESDTRILNMVTYLGAHPINLTRPLTNENNGAITNINITASFQYQGRIENTNASYAHFNYNSGIVNAVGGLAESVTQEALPFLLKDGYDKHSRWTQSVHYLGAANMFTGSPYIVIGAAQSNPIPNSANPILYTPYLKFMPLNVGVLNGKANASITSTVEQRSGTIVALDSVPEGTYDPVVDPAVALAVEYAAAEKAAGTVSSTDVENGQANITQVDLIKQQLADYARTVQDEQNRRLSDKVTDVANGMLDNAFAVTDAIIGETARETKAREKRQVEEFMQMLEESKRQEEEWKEEHKALSTVTDAIGNGLFGLTFGLISDDALTHAVYKLY